MQIKKRAQRLRVNQKTHLTNLIILNLLGGLKYAIGENILLVNNSEMTVSEVFQFLKMKSKNSNIINSNNILISINGIDANVLGGQNAVVRDGDKVTLVTIVHGG